MKLLACLLLLIAGDAWSQAQTALNSFAYVLQADSLAKTKSQAIQILTDSGRDWFVLDANYSGDEPWTAADLAAIRAGKPGRKIIAYLSIGEAEDYRAYWHPEWDPGHSGKKPAPGAPPFLLGQNPEWKGNYRVKYWQPEWQRLILPQVDKIMTNGFDGVYLDIVDGFETFEHDGDDFIDDRLNPETKQSYRRDMVDWVKTIAARARKANPAALIIPQNGSQLLAQSDFLIAIDAVGVEDLFSNGGKLQRSADTKFVLECLAPLIAAHKPVLDIEYATRPEHRIKVQALAREHGFVWILTDRELKTLGESGN